MYISTEGINPVLYPFRASMSCLENVYNFLNRGDFEESFLFVSILEMSLAFQFGRN